jgi:hypothetical protein
MFWNRKVAKGKHRFRLPTSADSTTYERRSICPDCVYYVVAQLAPDNLK